jgi:hypothetical protein
MRWVPTQESLHNLLHTPTENKKPATEASFVNIPVGRTGFEPATPWSQTTYSTGLNYLPSFKGRQR